MEVCFHSSSDKLLSDFFGNAEDGCLLLLLSSAAAAAALTFAAAATLTSAAAAAAALPSAAAVAAVAAATALGTGRGGPLSLPPLSRPFFLLFFRLHQVPRSHFGSEFDDSCSDFLKGCCYRVCPRHMLKDY